MYIAPNSTIKILRGVPLDNTYNNTIFFEAKAAQTTYFSSLAKYTLTEQTYTRHTKGKIRLAIQAENLFDCNYLMFQNTSFGNKWFYAFISKVEYINNDVSEISFEIDVMQSYHFDYTMQQCFVEREHSANDRDFANTAPENIEKGDEYVCYDKTSIDLNRMSLCVLANKKLAGEETSAEGSILNHIYSPVRVYKAKMSVNGQPETQADIDYLDYIFDQLSPDDIICVYQYPYALDPYPYDPEYATFATGVHNNIQTINAGNISTPESLDGYIPRNKKLFCYPYNMVLVSNNAGQTAVYRYEDFSTNEVMLSVRGTIITVPAAILYPRNHKGLSVDYENGLLMTNFPQCAWNGDAFKAWWAQNKSAFVTSTLASVVSTLGNAGVSIAASNATSANPGVSANMAVASTGLSLFGQVAGIVAQQQRLRESASQTHGQTQTDSLNPALERQQFDIYQMTIKAEYAKRIDDYFTRFGYSTQLVKVPNRNVRPYFTYTKTVGCEINGLLPADDIAKICSIYDNGITFWTSGAYVGNYGLDNSPSI